MPHDGVLEIDRADPFSARFDQVLGAVGDAQVALCVDGGDIASAQPAVGSELLRIGRLVVITARDPGTAALQFAGRHAVPGQGLAVVIDDPQLD